jgi:uncharacterized repeat protein (TIGR01451 family)
MKPYQPNSSLQPDRGLRQAQPSCSAIASVDCGSRQTKSFFHRTTLATVLILLLVGLTVPTLVRATKTESCTLSQQSDYWIPQDSGTGEALNAVYFLDSGLGWVVGNAGTILATTDDGTTWDAQLSNVTADLQDVHFTDANTGWVVGSSGTILHTTDGGATWHVQNSGTSNDLQALDLADVHHGWVVGRQFYAAILHTNDGSHWYTQTLPPGYSFLGAMSPSAIDFWDQNTGWVAPWGGTPDGGVLATTDGGTTWVQQTTDGVYYMTGVSFVSANEGWAVGYQVYTPSCSGIYLTQVFHTVDGGNTWTKISSICGFSQGIDFVDAAHGWLVLWESQERILASTDGGASWKEQHAASDLRDIHMIDAQHGWAVGENGTILRYMGSYPALDKQVAFNGDVCGSDILTYTMVLTGPGLSVRLWDPLPDAVHYVTDSLTGTLTPPAVYSPTVNAVTWQGTLLTDTVQMVRFQVTSEITDTRLLSSPIHIVNTAWLTDTESGRSTSATAAVTMTPPPLALDKRASFDGARLYNGDRLTYTLTLTGPGLDALLWDPLPDAAHYVSGSLTSTLTPPTVYSPTARAIIWQGTLPTDTTGVVQFQVTVDVGYEGPSPVSLANTARLTATQSGRSASATASVGVTIPPSTMDWFIETVDGEGYAGRGSSLSLDGTGHPHISYYDGYPNYDLKYARYDGASWHIETVDSGWMMGHFTSLALDGADRPHVSYSYFDANYSGLKYAWHDGASWHIETVDNEEDVGWYTSLALDGTGRPHISYHDSYPNYDLKYAWRDGTSWHTETVDSEGDAGYYTSLALDAAGRPHISYYDGYPNYDLKYAWHDGASWHVETVDGEGNVGYYTSLALDAGGRPHISYRDGYPNYDLKYVWRDGTSWHTETVDSEGDVGDYTSLALDEAGRPHISYHDGYPNYDLKYAWRDGTNWQIETVDSEGNVGTYTSLALDEGEHPHISYYDFTNGNLKYAWQLPFLLIKRVTPGDSLNDVNALTHTLAYSLTLFGPGLSVRFQDPLPDNVHYVPGSISSTLTPPAAYSPTLNAVIWEGTLPTDTAQTIRFQVMLEITSTRFLSAPLSIGNAAWMDDLDYDRRVMDTATVTIMPPPLALYKQATPSDGLRNNDTLTYTLTISGPGLNVRLWDPLPPSVRYVPGSITDTIGVVSGTLKLPAAVYSPTAHAVLWQGMLPTDTVEVIRFQVTRGITGTGSLSLSLPIVNTAWLTNTDSGWSVSDTVIVNGYRRYLPLVMIDN